MDSRLCDSFCHLPELPCTAVTQLGTRFVVGTPCVIVLEKRRELGVWSSSGVIRNTRRRSSASNMTIMTVLHKFKKMLLVSECECGTDVFCVG